MFFSDIQTAIRMFLSSLSDKTIVLATDPLIIVMGRICIFFWILVLIWVLYDASKRQASTGASVLFLCLIVITTPLFGLPLYMILRPKEINEINEIGKTRKNGINGINGIKGIKEITKMEDKKILKKREEHKKSSDSLRECSSCGRINKSQGIYCMYCGSSKE